MPEGLDAPRHPVVILTRSPERNAPLRSRLEAGGLTVLELQCFRTEPIRDQKALASALADLRADDLLVLTSTAASAAIATAVDPSTVRAPVAAIGAATAAAAARAGLHVTFVATRPDGATLARELPMPAGDVVLARSDLAARELPGILAERGASVREIDAYRTVPGVTGNVEAVALALGRGDAVVVLGSPSSLEGLLGAIPDERLKRSRLVAIGRTTAAAITARLGIRPAVADGPDVDAMFRMVLDASRMEVPA